jgi:hypothetical protein
MQAALASIIKQEKEDENQGAANIKLSAEEEDFLEKKILEILDRNKRGEGYVQQA